MKNVKKIFVLWLLFWQSTEGISQGYGHPGQMFPEIESQLPPYDSYTLSESERVIIFEIYDGDIWVSTHSLLIYNDRIIGTVDIMRNPLIFEAFIKFLNAKMDKVAENIWMDGLFEVKVIPEKDGGGAVYTYFADENEKELYRRIATKFLKQTKQGS